MPQQNNEQNGYSSSILHNNRTAARADYFQTWERRGRGWDIFPQIVYDSLEPQFEPFVVPLSQPTNVVDDARRPSALQSLFGKVRSSFREPHSNQQISSPVEAARQPQQRIQPSADDASITELQLFLPQTLKVSTDTSLQLLLSFDSSRFPISFEVIGKHDTIITQVACRSSDARQIAEQIQAHFPDSYVGEKTDSLKQVFCTDKQSHCSIVEFGLAQPFMLPLRTVTSFEPDALIPIIAALSELNNSECGMLQILFQKARHNWTTEIMRSLTDDYGKPFFTNRPDLLPQAKQKIAQPLFAVVVRVAVQSMSRTSAQQIAKRIGSKLEQFANPTGNQLIPLTNEGYDTNEHEKDVLQRTSHRSGMLLNAAELISLVHPPSASVKSPKLMRHYQKTKAAPTVAIGHKLTIGVNDHRGHTQSVSLSPSQRTQHTYLIGASGSGKSTLMLNMARQDIENGDGCCVLDPHGDLIETLLGYIPESRHKDVILFDPADSEYPIGFNILSAHSDLEKTLLASDLVAVFRRLASTSWGDQMNTVLSNAVLAMLEGNRNSTLFDLRRFLVEGSFRKEFLQSVEDSEVVYYWEKAFPLLSGKPQASILTRLDTFLRPKVIRNMVAQKENRLDFKTIMNERKILLARLAQGAIGEENAYLLGAMLVSKLHQLALARQEVAEHSRPNFYLYIDEFQHFLTPSMATLLSGARKFHLGLILAHQDLRQLLAKDTEIAHAVLANPFTRICFRLGDADATKLADGFSFFAAEDLQNLSVGEAIARFERNEYDFNLKTFPLHQIDKHLADERRQKIREHSRAQYAVKWEAIEAEGKVEVKTSLDHQEKAKAKEEDTLQTSHKQSKPPQEKLPQTTPQPAEMLSGKGGQQHKYLQHLVKRIAENKGYQVTIEKSVLGGTGKVDVSLERDNLKVACEISVTTPSEYELQNIRKCLAAGYKSVIVISANEKHLNNIKQRAQAELSADDLNDIVFLQPESFYAYLESLTLHLQESADRVKGFKVNVAYRETNETETKLRSQALAEIISNAKKRRAS